MNIMAKFQVTASELKAAITDLTEKNKAFKTK